jgi:hypothetical protein
MPPPSIAKIWPVMCFAGRAGKMAAVQILRSSSSPIAWFRQVVRMACLVPNFSKHAAASLGWGTCPRERVHVDAL